MLGEVGGKRTDSTGLGLLPLSGSFPQSTQGTSSMEDCTLERPILRTPSSWCPRHPVHSKNPIPEESLLGDAFFEDPILEDSIPQNSIPGDSIFEDPILKNSILQGTHFEDPIFDDCILESSILECPIQGQHILTDSTALRNSSLKNSILEAQRRY